MKELVNYLVKEISKTYKITSNVLENLIVDHLEKTPKLSAVLESDMAVDKIIRTKVFKEFYKKLKKDVYYSLRTYQRDDEHISTAERMEHLQSYIGQLDEFLSTAKSVIDLGGGMFPAFFPFEKYPNIKNYTWLDKDKVSFEKLMDFKQKNDLEQLELICEKIGAREFDEVDITFMLKLVPVLARQEKALLGYLARVPTKVVVVTGSKEAMVKKQDIKTREDFVLKDFIKLTGKKVLKEIEIENEFGYVIS